MPEFIIDLYRYFLLYPSKESREAFERFYDANGSRRFVRRYGVLGKKFYNDFMSKYSREVREMNNVPFIGVMTPRGLRK